MLTLGIALCKSALHIVRMLRIRTARRCGRQFSHLLGLAISEHETNVELDGIGELVESGLLCEAHSFESVLHLRSRTQSQRTPSAQQHGG